MDGAPLEVGGRKAAPSIGHLLRCLGCSRQRSRPPHCWREGTTTSQQPARGSGTEAELPLKLTLVRKGKLNLPILLQLFADNSARIIRLPSKAKLRPGY